MASMYGVDVSGSKHVAAAAAVAREVLAVHAADVDAAGRFPSEAIEALAAAGLTGLFAPGQLGGGGQGPRVFASVVEELARGCPSTAMIYVMHVTASQVIAASILLDSRDTILREIAACKHLTTLAFSEAGSRSQFWAPLSTLDARDGGYLVSAHKSWVTSARHADSFVSNARRPGATSSADSVIYLLRPRAAEVRPKGIFNGLGLRGNDSAPVDIEGYRLSDRDLISAMGDGTRMTIEVVVPWFCVGTAALANGLCLAAVEATAAHLSGAGYAQVGALLRDLPTLRARLAEMSVRTEQARALLGHALGGLEIPAPSTPVVVMQSRLAALQAAIDVTDLAMKAGGGAAYSRQLPLERLFRDARAGWVMAPTVDHLHDFVGRALTGLPLLEISV
jgi:alkylation response protein AidB-like acyl-CoA dehydrogenase